MQLARVLTLLVLLCCLAAVSACPVGCECQNMRQREFYDDSMFSLMGPLKAVCTANTAFVNASQFKPNALPLNTVVLDMSSNILQTVNHASFSTLSALQKLLLNNNHLNHIDDGAFIGLSNLNKLDLSKNQLAVVNAHLFRGLRRLEKLSLSGNHLKSLPEGVFGALHSLQRVDFQSAYLTCDCQLTWLSRWSKKASVRIHKNTTCAVPQNLAGKKVRDLQKAELQCGENEEVKLPLFVLEPTMRQVVFEGDKLPFKCSATQLHEDDQLIWVHKDTELSTNRTAGMFVSKYSSTDSKVHTTSLVIENLKMRHGGLWSCLAQTQQGESRLSVDIVVIPKQARSCMASVSVTNKGTFVWPQTVAGVRRSLPCKTGRPDAPRDPHAYYTCTVSGQWQFLDTNHCEFQSELTRVLEQMSKADLNNMTILELRANKLQTYLEDATDITDYMDIIFISRIVQALASRPELQKDILRFVSMMMDVDPLLLTQAQLADRACSRLVQALEGMPRQLLMNTRHVQAHSKHIALEAYKVSRSAANFPDIVCVVTTPPGEAYSAQTLKCSRNNTAALLKKEGIYGYVSISGSSLGSGQCQSPDCSSSNSVIVQVLVYSNARLFPHHKHADHVQSSVMATSFGVKIRNQTKPVGIGLWTGKGVGHTVPSYWDFSANDGQGGWRGGGCTVQNSAGNMTTMACSQHRHFALLLSQNSFRFGLLGEWLDSMMAVSPVIWVTSLLLVIATLTTAITYCAGHRSLTVPSKVRHSVVNMCVALCLLVLVFTLGVHITANALVCQVAGISIHYFSICTLFWITITTYNMYKKFVRADRGPVEEPELVLESPIQPGPMLRFYLLGWGVALIVCGVTAAVNLDNYAGDKDYCFLSLEPCVGAFFVPVGVLLLINIVFFLCICCLLHGSRKPLLEEEVENEDTPETQLTSGSVRSLDLQYQPISQLNALAALLLLYMLTWTAGAFAVAQPFTGIIPHQHIIFSYLYAVTGATLSVFIIVFYCFGRQDVRQCWKVACLPSKTEPKHQNSNGHANESGSHMPLNASVVSSSSKSTDSSKSSDVVSGLQTPSNQNNVVPGRSISVPEYPSFYNPRQNGVAKKYWGKNRTKSHMFNKDGVADKSAVSQPYSQCFEQKFDNNTHLSIEIQITDRWPNESCDKSSQADIGLDSASSVNRHPPWQENQSSNCIPANINSGERCNRLLPAISCSSPCCSKTDQPGDRNGPYNQVNHTCTASLDGVHLKDMGSSNKPDYSAISPLAYSNYEPPIPLCPGERESGDGLSLIPHSSAGSIEDSSTIKDDCSSKQCDNSDPNVWVLQQQSNDPVLKKETCV